MSRANAPQDGRDAVNENGMHCSGQLRSIVRKKKHLEQTWALKVLEVSGC